MKYGNLLGLDLHFIPCLGIPSRIGFILPHHEAAKPPDLDPVAFHQCIFESIKDQIDNLTSLNCAKSSLAASILIRSALFMGNLPR